MATGGQRRTRWERVAALEMPPGRWEQAWTGLHRSDVLLRIGLCMLTAVVVCAVMRGWYPPFTYRSGQVLPRDVVARVPFETVDREQSEAARDLARRQVRWVYQHDPLPLDRLTESLMIAVGGVLVADSPNEIPQIWADFLPQADSTLVPVEEESNHRFERIKHALTKDRGLIGFRKDINDALARFRERGFLGKQAPRAGQANNDEIEVFPAGRPDKREVVKIADVLIGSGKGLHDSLRRELDSPELVEPTFDWLLRRITPTLLRDDRETKKAMDRAAQAVGDVIVHYPAGDFLAPAGEPLTSDQIRLLRLEYEAAMAARPWSEMIERASAIVILLLALLALASAHLVRRAPRLAINLRSLLTILGMVIATIALAVWASADQRRAEVIPVLLFGQTLAIAYHQELALMLTAIVAVIIALIFGHALLMFLLLIGVAFTTVIQLGRIRNRSKLIYVGLSSGVVAFLLTVCLAVLDNQPIQRPLWILASYNAFLTVAAGFLMTGLLPFIEKAFGVLTDMTLLELGDVSHPLIQQLVQRAPATYNHSITVGSIAEAAAEAIGARGLLVRVGACYHDVGKMLKPGYFIENQAPASNRHDSLVPAMSTLVIIAHIKDGADLARQHGLPQAIIDFIEQHHGTTLVEYFFGRANEQHQADPKNGSAVDENLYRYPGPKPQTKEAGVLMLADAVESASRSLVDPAPARIASLVREIAERKLDDGQFDESGLTLRELRTIEDSIIKSLIANYHGRVKYPDQKTA